MTLRKARCAERKKVDGSRPAVRGEAVREVRECAGNLAVALKISLSLSLGKQVNSVGKHGKQ